MRPKSLISDYNPLLDPNLQGHFATKNKQKNLRKAGLVFAGCTCYQITLA